MVYKLFVSSWFVAPLLAATFMLTGSLEIVNLIKPPFFHKGGEIVKAVTFLLAAVLLFFIAGCSDPVTIESETDIYSVYLEDAQVKLTFDLTNDSGKIITVANHNELVIGIRLEDYDHEEILLFKDYWISSGDVSADNSWHLQHGMRIWGEVMVYNSQFAGVIEWAIAYLPGDWREWLDEHFGEEWLYDQHFIDIELSSQ